MALKARLNKQDHSALAEAIRAEYREDGDEFVLDVTPVGGYALEDLSGLKTTVGKLKSENKTLKDQVKAYEVDGELVDPDQVQTALKTLKELGNLSPQQLAEEKVKSALKQAEEKFNKTLGTKDGEVKELSAAIERVMVDQAATAAIASKKGNVKLLLPHVKGFVKVVKDGKDFKVQVVDHEGNPKIHVEKGKTSEMTLEQLIDEMSGSDDFASAFEATGKAGGQTKPDAGKGAGRPKVISSSDQAAIGASLESIAKGEVAVTMD